MSNPAAAQLADAFFTILVDNSIWRARKSDWGGRDAPSMLALIERDARRRLETIATSIRRSDISAIRASTAGLCVLLDHLGAARAAAIAKCVESGVEAANLGLPMLESACDATFATLSAGLAVRDSRAA